jgi:AGCS family alanine or glycine:cation symporter
VSKVVYENFGVPFWISGLIMAVLAGSVILGGVKSITAACEMLVPFMAAFYIGGCLIILLINRAVLGETVELIFSSAFTPRAAGGGFIGTTVMTAARYGIARGLFTSESGLGSSSIVAAAAKTRNPVKQALVSSTSTFWDTVVLCALTGLVLVSTIIANPSISVDTGNTTDGAALTSLAFNQIPVIGPLVLTLGIIVFAFSTILGWSYYGERGAEYLFGKAAILPYKAVYVLAIFFGAIMSLATVWNIADSMNILMAVPNLVCILMLSGVIAGETRYYLTGNNIETTDLTPIPEIGKNRKKIS